MEGEATGGGSGENGCGKVENRTIGQLVVSSLERNKGPSHRVGKGCIDITQKRNMPIVGVNGAKLEVTTGSCSGRISGNQMGRRWSPEPAKKSAQLSGRRFQLGGENGKVESKIRGTGKKIHQKRAKKEKKKMKGRANRQRSVREGR